MLASRARTGGPWRGRAGWRARLCWWSAVKEHAADLQTWRAGERGARPRAGGGWSVACTGRGSFEEAFRLSVFVIKSCLERNVAG